MSEIKNDLNENFKVEENNQLIPNQNIDYENYNKSSNQQYPYNNNINQPITNNENTNIQNNPNMIDEDNNIPDMEQQQNNFEIDNCLEIFVIICVCCCFIIIAIFLYALSNIEWNKE